MDYYKLLKVAASFEKSASTGKIAQNPDTLPDEDEPDEDEPKDSINEFDEINDDEEEKDFFDNSIIHTDFTKGELAIIYLTIWAYDRGASEKLQHKMYNILSPKIEKLLGKKEWREIK